ncbi:MAG: DNA mismatch repair endonuclease MutL [Bradymonadia bacterium]|jgi:DNA mismatch repair protein MutL
MNECRIQLLDPALCSQIAAGEVLERASSAVKELVENAIDADSSRIEIEIEEGGRKLIRVSDNGCGMSEEEAKLSILRHATSKIRSVHDLEAIASLGFRGEALASMAAVSRMQIISQKSEESVGIKLEIEGAHIVDSTPIAVAHGTQICMADMFFNTPARLKFLKTNATENRRVYEIVEQLALANPNIHFQLSIDGRIKLDAPPNDTLKERALSILGRNLFEKLYQIKDFTLGPLKLHGLFSSPDFSVNDRARIYTFVNKRAVKDRTINAAVLAAYKEFLHGKYPCVIINIEIPHDLVDVNVHPAKTELRFEDQDLVFRSVYRSLRQSLSETPWIARSSADFPAHAPHDLNFSTLPSHAFSSPEQLSPTAPRFGFSPQNAPASPLADFHAPLSPPFELDEIPLAEQATQAPIFKQEPNAYFSSLQYLGQLSNTYLLAIDHNALVVIDQHAAHERINYERLKAITEGASTDVQNLLFPLIVELDARLAQTLEEYHDFFDELGIQIDAIAENNYALKAVPNFLIGYDYDAMLRAALTDLAAAGRSTQFQDIIDDILATMACHRSVRAGLPLSQAEARELFRQMDASLFKSNCPHGRPVHFVLTHDEIEKRFQRR